MKRVILILTVLIMNAYAGNCYLMSNDELREIESSYWDNLQVSVKFPSGVLCNHARFLNVRTFSGDGCISENEAARDIILGGRHIRVVFDEFGMPLKTIDVVSENASCEKLYVEFKSKVKDMR